MSLKFKLIFSSAAQCLPVCSCVLLVVLDRNRWVEVQRQELIICCKHIQETQTRSHFIFSSFLTATVTEKQLTFLFFPAYQKLQAALCLQALLAPWRPRGQKCFFVFFFCAYYLLRFIGLWRWERQPGYRHSPTRVASRRKCLTNRNLLTVKSSRGSRHVCSVSNGANAVKAEDDEVWGGCKEERALGQKDPALPWEVAGQATEVMWSAPGGQCRVVLSQSNQGTWLSHGGVVLSVTSQSRKRVWGTRTTQRCFKNVWNYT